MTRLLVFCVAILAFTGFISASTFKDDLLEKLQFNEDRLIVAIQNAQNHGFGYSRGVYENLLKQVHEQRTTIKALGDDVRQGEPLNEVAALVKLDSLIFVRIAQISNAGRAKTGAIYLAAMKTLTHHDGDKTNPQTFKKQVETLVELEEYEALHPGGRTSKNGFSFSNAQQIVSDVNYLIQEMEGWLVPSFDDFYRVANRTRVSIAKARELKMTKEADKMAEELTQFDSITLNLANLFPLSKKDDVESYFNTSKSHYDLYVSLKGAKSFEK